MTRYRAVTFNHRFGPWLGSVVLAQQDAVEAGEGSRDPRTGTVYLSVGTTIEQVDGEADMSTEETRWGEALQVLHDHREKALDYAREQLMMAAEHPQVQSRWLETGNRIALVLQAAAKDELE